MLAPLMALALGACYQAYYVADIHKAGDGLVMTKCALDGRGEATDQCHDEAVEVEETDTKPDAADIAAVGNQLARETPAPLPAASDAAIARAFQSDGVRRLVEQCRTAYAPDVSALRFAITVTPTGEITDVVPQADGKFADCADRALRTANIAPFHGAPVHAEEQLAL